MFRKVLIANRGEIACRIARTLRKLGVGSVAVHSEADAGSMHVAACDEAVAIGPGPAAQSYLDMDRILAAAKATGAEAIHPGYGFLSENPAFAEACEAAGMAFIGPTPSQMRDFGLKHTARELAAKGGVPLLPGTGILADASEALARAAEIGYPVMLKSTGGGGGIGMQAVHDAFQLASAWETVSRLSKNNFKHAGLYLEKFVARARHIEVQVFGDGKGKAIALGERDCSSQRRNQKVLEETPAPGISHALRGALQEVSVSLCRSIAYRGAGTVEFVVDADAAEAGLAGGAVSGFYFLEVNTRLQVEHGVTEEVSGVDLVEWMVRLAAGELDDLDSLRPTLSGAAIQARVYAENPRLDFRPGSGLITEADFPADTRVDTWIEAGTEVPPFYDPLLAKVIAKGKDRDEALGNLRRALAETRIGGIETNLEFLRAIAAGEDFASGRMITRTLAGFSYVSHTIDVLTPGAQTTVQDYPGRTGHWDVGVPPSGPFDPLSFRLANSLLGNPADAAGLEITVAGPTLRFSRACAVAITGASLPCDLATAEGETAVRMWTRIEVPAGGTLKLGTISGAGMRAYLAVAGGLRCPAYLGSRSTFTLGNFGGHGGRALRAGDVLPLAPEEADGPGEPHSLEAPMRPAIGRAWDLGVLYGPHGAPDYFTPADMEMIFATEWEVHYNSNRTGVRLVGPKPGWARPDGGEAGLHPSNIHDNAYAIGAVDFTGDMPILLGPDGPSLGGFVCPATLAQAELWKMGQLKPGDKARFRPLTLDQARALERAQDELIAKAAPGVRLQVGGIPATGMAARSNPDAAAALEAGIPAAAFGADRCILHEIPARGDLPEVRYRRSGDRNILVEYGPPVLDLSLRFRAHALMERVRALELPGVLDLTPGIRSLQIHFDGRALPMERLLLALIAAEGELPGLEDLEVPSRIVHMPLSWDDEATHAVIRKYMQSVRADAPWCPSNIEFIRRINGLEDEEAVRRIVFDAEFLVMGLGDVYLGAPVATPLDPRHRLVTTKYNPARTWTVDNVVGIGGAYMCIYGMEGPGGYQLFGRTCQVWNAWRATPDFRDGKPWLLRFFDRIRFHPVTGKELLGFRSDFLRGRRSLRVEEGVFRLRDYQAFLRDNAASIAGFRERQRAAFREERERWKSAGQSEAQAAGPGNTEVTQEEAAGEPVEAQISGSVWKVLVSPGQSVAADAPLLILESMKMEFTVTAPRAGRISAVAAREGALVTAGQALVYLEP